MADSLAYGLDYCSGVLALMYWVHGKLNKFGTRYGPFRNKEIARNAIRHIKDTIERVGGIKLNYTISRKKVQ